MKYSATSLQVFADSSSEQSLGKLSRKQKKQLALQMEREKKEFEKRLKTQQSIKTLQELQYLLHQIHPDIIQAPTTPSAATSAHSEKMICDTNSFYSDTRPILTKEELVDVYLGNQRGEEESKDLTDEEAEADYVKDFSSVLENVENGYYYL